MDRKKIKLSKNNTEKFLSKSAPNLTDKQIEHLKKSREQIKNGEFHTNEEVKKMMAEWLKK